MNMHKKYLGVLAGGLMVLGTVFAPAAQAASVISSIERRGSSNTTPELVGQGLVSGVDAYVDRTHVYLNVPDNIAGGDYVKMANDDKYQAEFELDVTVDELARLFIFVDNRVEPMAWLTDGSVGVNFEQVSGDVWLQYTDIDELNDGSINNTFRVWAADVDAGTYTLFEQNSGRYSNMYGVAAVAVPLPAPLAMGLAGLGFAYWRRRRMAS